MLDQIDIYTDMKDKLDQFKGPPLDERPCHEYQRYGNCRKGKDCLYKH